MTEYKIGLGRLFPTVTDGTSPKASARYVIHRDVANDQWNVFKKVGLYEDFIQSFVELDDAQDFCDINNGVADAMGGE